MTGERERARLSLPRVAVLGPPALVCDRRRAPVRGHPGRLLVGIVASRGPCSLDRLTEILWGDTPPPTHRSAVHVHLGALRRALASHGGGCSIVRSEGGYSLELDGWEVDAALATDLLAASRRLLDDRPDASLRLIEQALDLWRGLPFAVDGEVVDVPSWHHLEAARRDAEELRVEALLRTGDAAGAEAAAARAVEAEPLRENRWGQLLRARYLNGRTADALATYQQARATLIESLGIEPGPELRDLEAAALTRDVARLRLIEVSEETDRQPPAGGPPMVGRERELQRVRDAVSGGGGVVLLGPPGVGKTRLATDVARRHGAGAVTWIDLRDTDALDDAPSLPSLIDWARRHPTGLVVLDNAETALPRAAAVVRALAARAPEVGVLVTSRAPLDADLLVELLQPLALPGRAASDDDIEAAPAVRALRAALSELAPSAVLGAAEAAQVARRAGGLPLLLRLSAAAARALPVDAIVARAPSAPGDETDLATKALLDLLDDQVRQAFLDLCVLGGDFDGDLAARAAGLQPGSFATAAIQLVDHGLLQARPDEALPYSVLEPIRAAAVRLVDEPDRRHLVLDRCVDACIDRARAVAGLTRDGAPSELSRRLEADLPRHRQALEHLARTGDAERALALVSRLELPLYALGWWAEKTELFDTALDIPGPPSPMRARAHAFRSRPGPMHQFDLAHAERAEEMAAALGHDRLVAFARHMRSIGCWWYGRTDEAIQLASDAADAFAATDRLVEWAEARKFLGVALVLHGDPEAGLQIQHETLAVVRRDLRSPFHVAHNLAYLGHCHRLLGDDTAARADWKEARELCAQVGNRGTAIHIAIGLGEIAADQGQPELSLEFVGEALELLRAGRAATYAPWAWTVAMRAHALVGDVHFAGTCAQRAFAGLPDAPPGEAVRLAVELAHLAAARHELPTAARLLGVAAATLDRRELPFPSPSEEGRRRDTQHAVEAGLGDAWREHLDAGRRCNVTEAVGGLFASSA